MWNSCVAQHCTEHHSDDFCVLCSAALAHILRQARCVSCDPNGAPPLCTLQSLVNEAFQLARTPSVASRKTGKALLCKQNQQPYTAAGAVQLCGLRRHLWQTAEPASAAQPAGQLCAHPICHSHVPQVNVLSHCSCLQRLNNHGAHH